MFLKTTSVSFLYTENISVSKGLERFNAQQLDQLSTDAKAAYLTDTYGVFSNEWYQSEKCDGTQWHRVRRV